MVWLVIFVALMIPLTAVVLDSPVVRSFVDRRGGGASDAPQGIKELSDKVGVLESELEVVSRQLAQLQEEQQYLQKMIEDPARSQGAQKALPKPGS